MADGLMLTLVPEVSFLFSFIFCLFLPFAVFS